MSKTSIKERNKAIRLAWEREQKLVAEGKGTRDWSQEQQKDILDPDIGKAKDDNGRSFEGQHMKSAAEYPEYQGDPDNIQFLTRDEHLAAHKGSWQNPTNWYYNPETKEFVDFGENKPIPCAAIKKVRHERLPKHEGTHLRVRLIMEQKVQRMVKGFLLAAVLLIAVEVEWQSRHSLRQNTDAGIHRRHLHRGAFIDPLARRASAKEKAVGAACGAVLGLIPGTEKPGKNTHIESPSFLKMGRRKAPTFR